MAIDLGFERLIVKNHHLRMYFVSDPESSYFESAVFNTILQYIQTMSVKFQLKQTGKHFILSYPQVKDMQEVYLLLEGIHKFVNESQLSVVN
jgi:transcription-repair coupling factor (superfamily II helicase)